MRDKWLRRAALVKDTACGSVRPANRICIRIRV